jgi:L-2-hydroxyglutarate oxidase
MELENENSYHILNYNSPGATGTPAYSAYIVKKLESKGFLDYPHRTKDSVWNFEKIIAQT